MEGIKEAYEKVSQIKPPTTFEQQIEIFRSRNLIIEDEKEAIEFLKRVNYYRLTGYTLTLKKNDRFFDGVTFNDIRHLYEFDKKLRNLLLEVLEDIEISFRTHIAYHHAHNYGPQLHRKEKRLLESNDKIFAVIIVMKRLCLNKVLWKNFVIKLSELMEAYNDVVDLKEIGFLNNWQEILNA